MSLPQHTIEELRALKERAPLLDLGDVVLRLQQKLVDITMKCETLIIENANLRRRLESFEVKEK